ncbi:hypothetical protein BV25DRAFT_1407748 [Artomyces pyxidatus]|uniref:Uncharacterized protein n=1 Tax=Artomyces pyxidatus TaxID=48021 RepID=A0ACB8TDU5_9AGAM|nr:hypothetical protein BV25DRAFT_1407748 [Artomyces pyxidatus]
MVRMGLWHPKSIPASSSSRAVTSRSESFCIGPKSYRASLQPTGTPVKAVRSHVNSDKSREKDDRLLYQRCALWPKFSSSSSRTYTLSRVRERRSALPNRARKCPTVRRECISGATGQGIPILVFGCMSIWVTVSPWNQTCAASAVSNGT